MHCTDNYCTLLQFYCSASLKPGRNIVTPYTPSVSQYIMEMESEDNEYYKMFTGLRGFNYKKDKNRHHIFVLV